MKKFLLQPYYMNGVYINEGARQGGPTRKSMDNTRSNPQPLLMRMSDIVNAIRSCLKQWSARDPRQPSGVKRTPQHLSRLYKQDTWNDLKVANPSRLTNLALMSAVTSPQTKLSSAYSDRYKQPLDVIWSEVAVGQSWHDTYTKPAL